MVRAQSRLGDKADAAARAIVMMHMARAYSVPSVSSSSSLISIIDTVNISSSSIQFIKALQRIRETTLYSSFELKESTHNNSNLTFFATVNNGNPLRSRLPSSQRINASQLPSRGSISSTSSSGPVAIIAYATCDNRLFT